MEPLRIITGTAAPLDRSDVDTDQIIPSEWLKRVERTGFGQGLFAEWRADPDFVLNQARYEGANILLAGPNFGTGSSREHAVWALQDYGFRAVVSSRFADIFRTNCTKAGLLPAQIEQGAAVQLMRAVQDDPSVQITVDVAAGTLSAPAVGVEVGFTLDDHTRTRFLEGLDEIDVTLRQDEAIAGYEASRPDWLPVTTG